jgi:hypothetical protein
MGKGSKRFNELRSKLIQLTGMVLRERAQDAGCCRSKAQNNDSSILGRPGAGDKSKFLASITEFNKTMVAQGKTFGKIADGGYAVAWGACDLQNELVLLRRQSGAGGTFLAEVKKAAQNMSELGKRLDACRPEFLRFARHRYIVSRHIFGKTAAVPAGISRTNQRPLRMTHMPS